jgi:NAD(P)-dependent dehydrogenase (short-subunit alcohol dehydrogenase family)
LTASRLEGQVAIVTGGSSGIGRATCLALAREAAHVIAVGRDPERLAETVALMRPQADRNGACVHSLCLDVQCEAQMQLMAERALQWFGHIDILVCSAGIVRPAGARLHTVAQTTAADFDAVIATNLKGLFLSNRAVLPHMIDRGSGDILNISSTSGLAGIPFDGPYCASKFGVIGLSEALAEEVGPWGVRVQVLLPGPFETEMWSRGGSGLRPAGNLPPGSRLADAIVYLLTLPRDTRLVAPIVKPLDMAMGSSVLGGRMSAKTASASDPCVPPMARGGVAEARGRAKELSMSTNPLGDNGRLKGKVVVVTGGTGGLGLAVCQQAAQEGAAVVVADVDRERIDLAVASLAPLTGAIAGHLGFAMDVRQEADNQELARNTLERYGRIDALVACAGILRKRGTSPRPLVRTTAEEWDEVLEVNLKGVFLSNRAVLPTMIEQRSGIILNISSVSGLKGRAHDGPYCASKFGVIGLSQSIADEVRTYGVKVQALMPDAIDTPFWDQNYPVPRPGDALRPERVADLILFMLTQPDDTVLVGPVIAPLGARRRKPAG